MRLLRRADDRGLTTVEYVALVTVVVVAVAATVGILARSPGTIGPATQDTIERIWSAADAPAGDTGTDGEQSAPADDPDPGQTSLPGATEGVTRDKQLLLSPYEQAAAADAEDANPTGQSDLGPYDGSQDDGDDNVLLAASLVGESSEEVEGPEYGSFVDENGNVVAQNIPGREPGSDCIAGINCEQIPTDTLDRANTTEVLPNGEYGTVTQRSIFLPYDSFLDYQNAASNWEYYLRELGIDPDSYANASLAIEAAGQLAVEDLLEKTTDLTPAEIDSATTDNGVLIGTQEISVNYTVDGENLEGVTAEGSFRPSIAGEGFGLAEVLPTPVDVTTTGGVNTPKGYEVDAYISIAEPDDPGATRNIGGSFRGFSLNYITTSDEREIVETTLGTTIVERHGQPTDVQDPTAENPPVQGNVFRYLRNPASDPSSLTPLDELYQQAEEDGTTFTVAGATLPNLADAGISVEGQSLQDLADAGVVLDGQTTTALEESGVDLTGTTVGEYLDLVGPVEMTFAEAKDTLDFTGARLENVHKAGISTADSSLADVVGSGIDVSGYSQCHVA